MGVHVSDSATISDLVFSRIEVDVLPLATGAKGAYAGLTTEPKLLRLHIGEDCWGHDSERGHIQEITLEDIAVYGHVVPALELSGYDEDHAIRDLTLRRVLLNGQPVLADELKISRNPFTEEPRFEEATI